MNPIQKALSSKHTRISKQLNRYNYGWRYQLHRRRGYNHTFFPLYNQCMTFKIDFYFDTNNSARLLNYPYGVRKMKNNMGIEQTAELVQAHELPRFSRDTSDIQFLWKGIIQKPVMDTTHKESPMEYITRIDQSNSIKSKQIINKINSFIQEFW